MILALRTDSPKAELYLYENNIQIDSYTWLAERRLADELLVKIEELLKKNTVEFGNLSGIIIFTGSGSFTGLRIGTTVANSLGYAQSIRVIDSDGVDWIKSGLKKLKSASNSKYVVPRYDSEPNITSPKPKT